jgi:TrwC relaxase
VFRAEHDSTSSARLTLHCLFLVPDLERLSCHPRIVINFAAHPCTIWWSWAVLPSGEVTGVAVVATLSKGYDLDYVWRQSGNAAAKDSAGYYIGAAAGGGEPPGRWWGPAAAALGFATGQVVERGPYDLLFGERKAPDGSPLGRPASGGRAAAELYARLLAAEPHATAERRRELRMEAASRARPSPLYFDLTLSFSKSISIFHASLGENARLARQAGDAAGESYWSGLVAEADAMIWQAVWAGFDYFQREAGYTRTGSHASRVDGRETGQWREADLVVTHWLRPSHIGHSGVLGGQVRIVIRPTGLGVGSCAAGRGWSELV